MKAHLFPVVSFLAGMSFVLTRSEDVVFPVRARLGAGGSFSNLHFRTALCPLGRDLPGRQNSRTEVEPGGIAVKIQKEGTIERIASV